MNKVIKADLMLLVTAFVWGSAFVAQRAAMDHLGPYYFNALRFFLATLTLLPFIFRNKTKEQVWENVKAGFWPSVPVGITLLIGTSFQQTGIMYTTAGKAGFITGLYVLVVPIMGLFTGYRPARTTWFCAALAVIGMYFLSVPAGGENFAPGKGDFLVLCGTLGWAAHVIVIARYARKIDGFVMSAVQFMMTCVFSLVAALFLENVSMQAVSDATIPLIYCSIFSAGIGYTFQILAQKNAPPEHAAILLSTEAVFAVICGWLILGEVLSLREASGCALMFGGMAVSQLVRIRKNRTRPVK